MTAQCCKYGCAFNITSTTHADSSFIGTIDTSVTTEKDC